LLLCSLRAQSDPSTISLTPNNLPIGLVREIISAYGIQPVLVDPKTKAAAEKRFEIFGPVDKLPERFVFVRKGDRVGLVFDARDKGRRPANAEQYEQAIQKLVNDSFAEVARQGFQSKGADGKGIRYVLPKGSPVLGLVASVAVTWESTPPPDGTIDALNAEIERLRQRIRELENAGNSSGGSGYWQPVPVCCFDWCSGFSSIGYRYIWVPGTSVNSDKANKGGTSGEEESELAPLAADRLEQVRASLVPLDTAGWKAQDSDLLLWQGIRAYHDRNYVDAWKTLEAVNRLTPRDARAWYFRALAERALGDVSAAEQSRQQGRKAEGAGMLIELARALERVQGEPRRWLRSGR
jgi:tetratricopeptide (TPR) repeat protein